MLSWCTGYIDFNLTKLMIKKTFWVKDIFFCTPVVLKINYLDGNPEDPPRDGDTTIECLHEDCLGLILNMVIKWKIFHFKKTLLNYLFELYRVPRLLRCLSEILLYLLLRTCFF